MPLLFRLLTAIGALLTAAPVFAHEFWIDRDGGQWLLRQGHPPGSHEGPEHLDYDPAILVATACLPSQGRLHAPTAGGRPLRVTANCAALAFRLNSGYWTKTPYDTINRPRDQVPRALASWLSEETVVRIEHWRETAPGLRDRGLILWPDTDPNGLRVGDKFTVVATLDGRPQGGVTIAYDGRPRGVTDAAGRIDLRLRRSGLQRISGSLEIPLNDERADTHLRGASLNFQVP